MTLSAKKVWPTVVEDVYLTIKCEDLDIWR